MLQMPGISGELEQLTNTEVRQVSLTGLRFSCGIQIAAATKVHMGRDLEAGKKPRAVSC